MEEQFKPGDAVKLKSGGPDMTVERKLDDSFSCVWYAGGEIGYSTAYFAPETLRRVP